MGYARAAHRGYTFNLLYRKNWHKSWNDWDSYTGSACPFHEVKEKFIIKKELSNYDIASCFNLALKVGYIYFHARRFYMLFWITGNSDTKGFLTLLTFYTADVLN